MISIKVDQGRCNGCGNCVVACSLGQTGLLPAEGGQMGMEMYARPRLWIQKVDQIKWTIDICRHCEEPVCIDTCVAGAIERSTDGQVVLINSDKCVGCWSCVMECPFNAIKIGEKFDYDSGPLKIRVAYKCNGCAGRGEPVCAVYCPTGALQVSSNSGKTTSRQRRERTALIYSIDKTK